MLGRRGPAQAAFTNAELRELGRIHGVNISVHREQVELDPLSVDWLSQRGTFTARKNVELLQELVNHSSARQAGSDATGCPTRLVPAASRDSSTTGLRAWPKPRFWLHPTNSAVAADIPAPGRKEGGPHPPGGEDGLPVESRPSV